MKDFVIFADHQLTKLQVEGKHGTRGTCEAVQKSNRSAWKGINHCLADGCLLMHQNGS